MSTKRFDGGLERGEAFIGIDQSLTGFAVTALGSNDSYYTEVYKSPYFGVERLLDLQQFLSDFLEKFPPIDIAMEGSVLQSHAALKLGELAGAVKLEILKKGHYPLQVPPMTLKKFASGKGNAKKQEMLLQIYKKWGKEFSDDNAADSYALARLIRGVGINAMEKQIIDQLKDPKYRDEPRLA
jgi:crossover junction endodeoxyribonuclease RuvC